MRPKRSGGSLVGRLLGGRTREKTGGTQLGLRVIQHAASRLGLLRGPGADMGPGLEESRAIFDEVAVMLGFSTVAEAPILALASGTIWNEAGDSCDIWLSAECLDKELSFSVVGPKGRIARRHVDDPDLLLPDLERSFPLQYDVVAAPGGISLLFHDAETASRVNAGRDGEVVGRATFGGAQLRPGESGFRMAYGTGKTVEQRFGAYTIRIRFETREGWSG